MFSFDQLYVWLLDYPPASEARWEVANLTERKNLHTPVYGVKFVCLSVINFDPNYLGTCKTDFTKDYLI